MSWNVPGDFLRRPLDPKPGEDVAYDDAITYGSRMKFSLNFDLGAETISAPFIFVFFSAVHRLVHGGGRVRSHGAGRAVRHRRRDAAPSGGRRRRAPPHQDGRLLPLQGRGPPRRRPGPPHSFLFIHFVSLPSAFTFNDRVSMTFSFYVLPVLLRPALRREGGVAGGPHGHDRHRLGLYQPALAPRLRYGARLHRRGILSLISSPISSVTQN